MANSYTEFSVFIALRTQEERDWVNKTLSDPPEVLRPDWCEPEDADTDFRWELTEETPYSDPGVVLWSEGESNPDKVEEFFKMFLAEAPTQTKALGAEFCYRCEKPRPGEFGGAAVVVWVGEDGTIESDWQSSSSWLDEKLKVLR